MSDQACHVLLTASYKLNLLALESFYLSQLTPEEIHRYYAYDRNAELTSIF